MSRRVACRNFSLPQGCRFGDACYFAHDEASSSSSSAQPYTGSYGPTVEDLWDFGEQTEAERVDNERSGFCFDAAGSFHAKKAQPQPSAWANRRFVDVLKDSLSPEEELWEEMMSFHAYMEEQEREREQQEERRVCAFFLSGNCKFGDRCRYRHEGAEGAAPDKPRPVECGICLEAPEGSLYGLLSHCDCRFCLECIRSWRKEGVCVAKSNDQVRLCPLCRKESHFIVPSSEFLTGHEKREFIDGFKSSLTRKPCRYYAMGQDCPFGSSCFYMHGEGNIKASSVRILHSAEEETTKIKQVTLWDFVERKQPL